MMRHAKLDERGRCYVCGQPGHHSRNCWAPMGSHAGKYGAAGTAEEKREEAKAEESVKEAVAEKKDEEAEAMKKEETKEEKAETMKKEETK